MGASLRIQRTKSSCKSCGLEGCHKKLFGISENSNPRIAIMGEVPDTESIEAGFPFRNGAGRVLHHCIKSAGLNSKGVYLTYTLPCNAGDGAEVRDAFEYCEPGFREEMLELHKRGLKVVVAVGEMAQSRFGINGLLLKNRGSVFEFKLTADKVLYVIPTVTPEYIMRGNWAQELSLVSDLQKAQKIAADGWKPPVENFVTHPTIEWLEAKLEELRKTPDLLLAVDTEGWKGGWHRHWMTGFAVNETDAFCIPFKKQGGKAYWETAEESQRAQIVLKALLAEFPTAFQNAQFDIAVFEHLGIPVKRLKHDTMLAHHTYHCELPHDLGYIASIYATTPYWKDIVLASEEAFNKHNDVDFRTYNLRDCVVLHQILNGLLPDLEREGLLQIYTNTVMRLVMPTVRMEMNGMKLLKSRIPEWQKRVDDGVINGKATLFQAMQLPTEFSPTSPYHIRYLLFGELPASYAKAKVALASYDEPGCKKKRNTKVYQELVATIKAIDGTVPCGRTKGNLKVTAKGKAATDKQALNKMRIAALKELEDISWYRKRKPEHDKREVELQRLVRCIDALLNWSRWNKLKTTYYTFHAADDGRIHPSYPIHRTRTGRLASKGPKQLGSLLVTVA
jgi:uracil-DNA glycosylase family 4